MIGFEVEYRVSTRGTFSWKPRGARLWRQVEEEEMFKDLPKKKRKIRAHIRTDGMFLGHSLLELGDTYSSDFARKLS